MTVAQVLEVVQDFSQWRGDVYKLAMIIRERQKEDDAVLVETKSPEAAQDIRGQ